MTFESLGLCPELLRALASAGYDTPTPIQVKAIPEVLAGHDLMASAQTGTGTTAGFALPILQMLKQNGERVVPKGVRALVLVPTRELAAQVLASVRTYGAHTGLRALAVFGGVGINPQIQTLRRGIDILVATPGRLLDHLGQRTVDLSKVQTLVLDEADRMFDMGFIRDIRRIIERLPKVRQNLMFSATFAAEVRELAHTVLKDPAMVEVARRNAPAELVTHTVIKVDQDRKRDLLLHLFAAHGWHQVLVFCRTKHGSDALARKLEQSGVRTAALHGNKSQNARTRALADFKAGKLAALVATDIAARGLDIDSLPRVVNFELPNVPEDYIHRIGRTGRAGASGEALSLVSSDERIQLRDIERLLKREIETSVMPGFEPQHNHSVPRPAAGRPPAQKPAQARTRSGSGTRSGAPRPARSGGGGAAKPASHHSGQRHR